MQYIVVQNQIYSLVEIIFPGEDIVADSGGVKEIGCKGGIALGTSAAAQKIAFFAQYAAGGFDGVAQCLMRRKRFVKGVVMEGC